MNEELYQKIKKIDEEAAENYRVICLLRLGHKTADGDADWWNSSTLLYSFSWVRSPQGGTYWRDVSKKLMEI